MKVLTRYGYYTFTEYGYDRAVGRIVKLVFTILAFTILLIITRANLILALLTKL